MNYASTSNIQEVIKFHNLGDKILKQTLVIILLFIRELRVEGEGGNSGKHLYVCIQVRV